MRPAYLTSHAVAKLVGVSPSTVLAWIDKGLLTAHRTPGGHRRVAPSALLRFLTEHGMPVPAGLTPVRRLLVIDDDATTVRALKRAARRRAPSLALERADNAMDGLLHIGLFRPDAVLLDTTMPGMDALELCRHLRSSAETAHIIVVAVTGRRSRDLESAFREAGTAACFSKPLKPAELLDALGIGANREVAHT